MNPDSPNRDPRIYLAAERTFLAWLRTSLAMNHGRFRPFSAIS